ncbi:inositol monophosphatase family protein [Halovenus sp. HT40]|uniref:inositol monophosphatase family protein n=1 Tax=Halovenus sp. HT40 TaxID=3126691 RepID=UPI00300E8B66
MTRTETILETAITAATAGGTVALDNFDTDLAVDNKGDPNEAMGPADVVTEADRETQRRVVSVLTEADPTATIVGEENDAQKTVPETGRAWVIDPIDGTFNFIRGVHYWTTSVAATVDGEPVAACNFLPALDRTYTADDSDAFVDGTPISVSNRSAWKATTVAPIIPPSYGERSAYSGGVGELVEQFGSTVRYCSAQVTLALLARGALDGAVTPQRPNPWDSLAGVQLIRQAGGVVTDLDGERWTVNSDSMVASNGQIHEQLLEAAQELR